MGTEFPEGSQRQFCRQTSFHPSSPCFLPLFLSSSLSLSLVLSHALLSLLMAAGKKKKIRKQCSLKQPHRDNICSGWLILNMGLYNFETI